MPIYFNAYHLKFTVVLSEYQAVIDVCFVLFISFVSHLPCLVANLHLVGLGPAACADEWYVGAMAAGSQVNISVWQFLLEYAADKLCFQ